MNCQNPACAKLISQERGPGRKKRYCSESCKQKMKRVRAEQKRVATLVLQATRKSQQKLTIIPYTIEQANAYVKQLHRHHGAIPIARIALAVADESGLVRGVAIVDRPCNPALDDGWTLEVRRLCTDGCPNACSCLYGATWKAARAIGYRRLITYTLPEESGASLRAVGWKPVRNCGGKAWNHKKRVRQTNPVFLKKKTRWEMTTNDFASAPKMVFPQASETLPVTDQHEASIATGNRTHQAPES